MKKIILLVSLTLFFISCGKEERVIDNSVVSLDLYLADSVTNDVTIYNYPSMEISKANLLANAGITISSPISNIREFQKRIYILIPGEDKMIVLDAVSDTLLAVSDFPFGSGPFDISFANVADGFVMFKYAPYITNYDLVFSKSARTLDGKSLVTSIVDFGSYSFMTESQTQRVRVLDNRTYRSDGEIQLTGIPILSAITSESELFVVSQGYTTQVGEEAPVTIPTQIHFINPIDRTVRYTREMGDNLINANEVIPTDLATTPIGYAFVTTNKGMLRMDTRNNGNFFDVSKRIFTRIEYNSQRNGLYMLEFTASGTKLAEASAVNGRVVGDIEIPISTNCFHLSN
ncbi:MAG: hypothetical protein CVV25_08105 [Ignavibacteriae bacterium HGW-Ignavibacteriae-4]|jgi:hypothetical protein|nr:MAG: hypothetical protein CVV25_08105 [Ignavibacteriae bacterium HGW-Ignavibacteriae-4]